MKTIILLRTSAARAVEALNSPPNAKPFTLAVTSVQQLSRLIPSTMKINYKAILIATGLFPVGMVVAFFINSYYHHFVRYCFKHIYGDNVVFVGKDFHLFPNERVLFSVGLFFSILFILLFISLKQYRFRRAVLTMAFFFGTTILIALFDGKRLAFECSGCGIGADRITFHHPPYDKYYILSLFVSIIYIMTVVSVDRRKINSALLYK